MHFIDKSSIASAESRKYRDIFIENIRGKYNVLHGQVVVNYQ